MPNSSAGIGSKMQLMLGIEYPATHRSWRTLWRKRVWLDQEYVTIELKDGNFYDIRAQMRPWNGTLNLQSLLVEQSS